MGAEGWPGKRYPNMGAEGCTASATVIPVLLFRAILSLVVLDCYWCRNQNILEKKFKIWPVGQIFQFLFQNILIAHQ